MKKLKIFWRVVFVILIIILIGGAIWQWADKKTDNFSISPFVFIENDAIFYVDENNNKIVVLEPPPTKPEAYKDCIADIRDFEELSEKPSPDYEVDECVLRATHPFSGIKAELSPNGKFILITLSTMGGGITLHIYDIDSRETHYASSGGDRYGKWLPDSRVQISNDCQLSSIYCADFESTSAESPWNILIKKETRKLKKDSPGGF